MRHVAIATIPVMMLLINVSITPPRSSRTRETPGSRTACSSSRKRSAIRTRCGSISGARAATARRRSTARSCTSRPGRRNTSTRRSATSMRIPPCCSSAGTTGSWSSGTTPTGSPRPWPTTGCTTNSRPNSASTSSNRSSTTCFII